MILKPVIPKIRNNRMTNVLLGMLAIYTLLAAGYMNMRFAWQLLLGDAIRLTELSQNLFSEGTIAPASGAYQFGYAYPAANALLAHLTGASIVTLQTFVQPFLIVLLVPASYVAFRSLTGSAIVAMLASLLLFLQPEFLFEALRSSHAKVTWLMALMMLYVLARSFQPDQTARRFATWVIVFYFFTFALITSNSFFASNYIFGIAFAFFGAYALSLLRRERGFVTPQMRRLLYVTLASLLLAFLFIFYLYPPALRQFSDLQTIIDKIAVFFFNTDIASPGDPYSYVQSTWINTKLYMALTGFNWFILVLSFVVWLVKGWLLVLRKQMLPAYGLLLWLLYAAFAVMFVLSIVLDLAGVLSANMQVRLFPHLMVVAIPLASEGIVLLVSRARSGGLATHRVLAAALVGAFVFFSAASLLKVTNEPLLSNNWSFSSPGEQRSVQWVGDYLRMNAVWVGPDSRLATTVEAFGRWKAQRIVPYRSSEPLSRYLLLSTLLEANAHRRGYLLPDTRAHMKVYDNGNARLFFSRPRTPFQR